MKKYCLQLSFAISVGLFLLLTGCTHVASPYYSASANKRSLNKIAINKNKIAIGLFKDPKNTSSIMCRLEGYEKLPNDVTYANYIKKALKHELTHAGLYNKNSKIKLDAVVNEINFSSDIGSGNWIISMTFNDHVQTPYKVIVSYNFSTNFIADIACGQVAEAFVTATQKFLQTLYKNSHFAKTLSLTSK